MKLGILFQHPTFWFFTPILNFCLLFQSRDDLYQTVGLTEIRHEKIYMSEQVSSSELLSVCLPFTFAQQACSASELLYLHFTYHRLRITQGLQLLSWMARIKTDRLNTLFFFLPIIFQRTLLFLPLETRCFGEKCLQLPYQRNCLIIYLIFGEMNW